MLTEDGDAAAERPEDPRAAAAAPARDGPDRQRQRGDARAPAAAAHDDAAAPVQTALPPRSPILHPGDLQGEAGRRSLGCVKSPPAARPKY